MGVLSHFINVLSAEVESLMMGVNLLKDAGFLSMSSGWGAMHIKVSNSHPFEVSRMPRPWRISFQTWNTTIKQLRSLGDQVSLVAMYLNADAKLW